LMREIERGVSIVDAENLTFERLAKIYQEEKLIAPVYEDGVRVSGLRSYKDLRGKLKTLVAFFGAKRVAKITHGDIEKYKLKRLRDQQRDQKGQPHKDRQGKAPKLATINRELQLLRPVLNFAKRKGWIIVNPFELGEQVISAAAERKRERVLTREEE